MRQRFGFFLTVSSQRLLALKCNGGGGNADAPPTPLEQLLPQKFALVQEWHAVFTVQGPFANVQLKSE